MTHDETNQFLMSLAKKPEFEASVEEKQVYSVKMAVIGLIDFVTTSLEEIGIDGLHQIADPSLDDLYESLQALEAKADSIQELNLKQITLFAQVLIKNIKEKNPDLCSASSKTLLKAKEGL